MQGPSGPGPQLSLQPLLCCTLMLPCLELEQPYKPPAKFLCAPYFLLRSFLEIQTLTWISILYFFKIQLKHRF